METSELVAVHIHLEIKFCQNSQK